MKQVPGHTILPVLALAAAQSLAPAAPLAAQVPTDATVVAVRAAGTPWATQLLAVDPAGTATPFGRFASDVLPPLAVAVDPYDRDVLLAVDLGGTSRVLRLFPAGTSLLFESALGDLPGPCSQLAVLGDRVVATVGGPGGGLFALPRRLGGAAVPVLAQARAAAMHAFDPATAVVVLGWSGDPAVPGSDPGVGYADVDAGAFSWGPFPFAAPGPAPMTGLADLPTGASRQLLSFADGSFHVHLAGSTTAPQRLPTTPPVPSGGAVAMHSESGFDALALGGAAFPFLYRIDAISGAVTTLTGPLPGDPVDFAPPPGNAARVRTFGTPCGAPAPDIGWSSGLPQSGNAAFGFDVRGATALQPLVFAAGLQDTRSLVTVLPTPLPGGCLLHVDPAATLFVLTGSAGTARLPLPIPGSPLLIGVLAFVQAVQPQGTGLAATPAAALQIGA